MGRRCRRRLRHRDHVHGLAEGVRGPPGQRPWRGGREGCYHCHCSVVLLVLLIVGARRRGSSVDYYCWDSWCSEVRGSTTILRYTAAIVFMVMVRLAFCPCAWAAFCL